MKKTIFLALLVIGIFSFSSCGPVVFTYRLGTHPPPPWFYPNRVETVRYIYFPDLTIYYDLSLRNYIYLENNIWIKASSLPLKHRNIDLRKAKYKRINNYYDDNIKRYHIKSTKSRRTSTARRN